MFGSHLSIAGGLHNALLEAETLGMGTVQIFTKNQQQWQAPPLTDEAVAVWKGHRARLGFEQVVSHTSYLINLASPDPRLRRKSTDLLIEELRRCDVLGIPYLVLHPGAAMGQAEEVALTQVARALDEVHRALPATSSTSVLTCLEITAGQGTCLGHRLEHLASIIEQVNEPQRMAVCLDTAHLFAAGYDFRGTHYPAFRKELAKTIGIRRVKVWHLNDSRKDLGSRVDRHDHIGEGKIGLPGFAALMQDEAWRNVPMILETPKDKAPDGRDWDVVNIERLKSLL